MSARALALATSRRTTPVAVGVLQRRCACGAPREPANTQGPARHSDFSRVPARASAQAAHIVDDGLGQQATAAPNAAPPEPAQSTTPGGGTDANSQAETTQVPGAGGAAAPQPAQTTSKKGKVTQLDVITSATGALTGFPAIPGSGNLNSPGPFNDTVTGSCKNIHQMKFTLAGTTSSEVSLLRKVNRKATAGGTQSVHNGPDGPSAATVIRPNDTTIAVADSPGYSGNSTSAPFPVTYDADFELYAFDNVQNGVYAKLTYTVSISKKTIAEQNPTNQISNISKTLY